jgi:hypothetical protein
VSSRSYGSEVPRPRRIACLSFSPVIASQYRSKFCKSPGLINCVRPDARATQNFITTCVRRRVSEIEALRCCNVDVLIARFISRVRWSVRVASCNGTCLLDVLGRIYGSLPIPRNSRQICLCRRNTVSPDTESGRIYKALSPRNTQLEVCRAPGSHHANTTCG